MFVISWFIYKHMTIGHSVMEMNIVNVPIVAQILLYNQLHVFSWEDILTLIGSVIYVLEWLS